MAVARQKFYICEHCGNIIGLIEDAGVPVICCGEEMIELVPNTVDAAKEKHVPIVEANGAFITVKIGSAAHPMTPEHHIAWVYLQTKQGGQRKVLDPKGAPEITFALTDDDKAEIAYAYCNLHGLWKADAE